MKKEVDLEKIPDPKRHLIASLIKSVVRILGYFALFFDITTAAILLIISEAVGIGEELV